MANSVHDVSELKDEPMPTGSLDDLPEYGGFTEPPQPGPYRFRLPDLARCWEPYDTNDGQRVRVIFDRDNPLTIITAKDPKVVGDGFHTRLSNQERTRGGVPVSDLAYLLKAFGAKAKPASNKLWVEALVALSGKEFGADITYSWNCSVDRDIYVDDGKGGTQKVDGRKGCGWKYYQGDKQADAAKKVGYIGKANGEYPYEIQCQCGAVIRAFANLDQIRP